MRRTFRDVQDIPGLTIAYTRHRPGVARLRTAARLGAELRSVARESLALYRGAIAGFQPEVCISDFDSFSHVFGLLFDRPVISLDHQHVIDRCAHERVAGAMPRDFALTRAFVRAKLPGCRHYIVTSFYFPRPTCDHTTLVGPILRPEVLDLVPTTGEHVLVYQTGVLDRDTREALNAARDTTFVVYHRGEVAERRNLSLRAFDEAAFLADLASARAVICNGGYTTMSEALFLGKPVLSIPIRHQGEQELNGAYLAALGLGATTRRLDAEVVRAFVARADRPNARIAAGNVCAAATLDRVLEEAA